MKNHLRTVLIILILLSNVSCDQVTKSIVRKQIGYNQEFHFLTYFTLTKVENTGAFLSIGNALPDLVKTTILTILPIMALLFALIFVLIKKELDKITVTGLCFAIGGGIGNIYDRLLYGSVTDFLHFGIGPIQTGIFNMADLSITSGMCVLLLGSYFNRKDSANMNS